MAKNEGVMRVDPAFKALCLELRPKMEKVEGKPLSLVEVSGKIARESVHPLEKVGQGIKKIGNWPI